MYIVEACKQCLFNNSSLDVKQVSEIIILADETYILNVKGFLSYSGYPFFLQILPLHICYKNAH